MTPLVKILFSEKSLKSAFLVRRTVVTAIAAPDLDKHEISFPSQHKFYSSKICHLQSVRNGGRPTHPIATDSV
jgi:hypothetical protein